MSEQQAGALEQESHADYRLKAGESSVWITVGDALSVNVVGIEDGAKAAIYRLDAEDEEALAGAEVQMQPSGAWEGSESAFQEIGPDEFEAILFLARIAAETRENVAAVGMVTRRMDGKIHTLKSRLERGTDAERWDKIGALLKTWKGDA